MEKAIAVLHRHLNPAFMALWLSLKSIRCSRFPPSHLADSPRSTGLLTLRSFCSPMAPALSFRGHQWTYNPVRAGSCLLLLLVLSNLLLCQGNVCPSCGPDMFGIPLKFLRRTFSRVSRLSHDMRNLSTAMLNEFEEKYPQSKSEDMNAINDCHTNSLHAPEEIEKAEQMNNEDLTKWILMIQYLWTTPLVDSGNEKQIEKDLTQTIRTNAVKNFKKSYKIQAILERRFSQIIRPVRETLSDFNMPWSGYRDLVSSDEDVRHSALYNLLKCLLRDSRKVDMYSKILACRISDEC